MKPAEYTAKELIGALRRVGALLLRRIRYAGRFIFWTVKHRSFEHAAWLCAYEGYTL